MAPYLRVSLHPGVTSKPRHRVSRNLRWRHVGAAAAVCAVLFGGCGGGGTRPDTGRGAAGTASPIKTLPATAAPTALADVTSTPTLPSLPTPTPGVCDVGHPCAQGQFCELQDGVCGTDLDSGQCVDVPEACFGVAMVVCGCDGLNYETDCVRRTAKVSKAHDGPCSPRECQNACDCYAMRSFATPCLLECATCGNFWSCEDRRCLEHCGSIPDDVCDALCSRNEQCGADTYCEKPITECDGLGACRPRPQLCPGIVDPVCGCDGETYSNACVAGNAGVTVMHRGSCAIEPTPTPTPMREPTPTLAACVSQPCPVSQFCELPTGVCSSGFDRGTCVVVRLACSKEYAPECGCDGLTYGNECLRRGAMVQKAMDGPCDTVECQDDCDCYATRAFALPCLLDCATCENFWTCEADRCFEHCGPIPSGLCRARCRGNADCPADTFCQKAAEHCDGQGACRPRSQACPAVIDPVCGCDGRTYDNDCERERAGVSLAYAGMCVSPNIGFVSVRVVNGPSRQPVPGVEIALSGSDLISTTDADGTAVFAIPAGNYFVNARVCCAGPGFIEYHVPVDVEAGRTTDIELHACLECICASPDTPIATPLGDTPMHALAVGDLVYSVHEGQIVAVPVLQTNRVAVHAHHVVRLRLATGAVLEISPGHPTADGRTVGALRAGDRLADVEILAAEIVSYAYVHTYDILPASDSGVYFAGGVPIGSTLHQARPK